LKELLAIEMAECKQAISNPQDTFDGLVGLANPKQVVERLPR
jgi:hypothetical protein